MVAIVSINSRRGLRIEAHHRNQPNKSKLALYKSLLHFYSHLEQLYISNKTEHFSYKGGCGMRGRTHIEAFKKELQISNSHNNNGHSVKLCHMLSMTNDPVIICGYSGKFCDILSVTLTIQ